MQTKRVGSLVAIRTSHGVHPMSIMAALREHRVQVMIVALQRNIAGRVAIHTSRTGKYFINFPECFDRAYAILYDNELIISGFVTVVVYKHKAHNADCTEQYSNNQHNF
jgi:hypothetical protein